jgi:hypothetical protein
LTEFTFGKDAKHKQKQKKAKYGKYLAKMSPEQRAAEIESWRSLSYNLSRPDFQTGYQPDG